MGVRFVGGTTLRSSSVECILPLIHLIYSIERLTKSYSRLYLWALYKGANGVVCLKKGLGNTTQNHEHTWIFIRLATVRPFTNHAYTLSATHIVFSTYYYYNLQRHASNHSNVHKSIKSAFSRIKHAWTQRYDDGALVVIKAKRYLHTVYVCVRVFGVNNRNNHNHHNLRPSLTTLHDFLLKLLHLCVYPLFYSKTHLYDPLWRFMQICCWMVIHVYIYIYIYLENNPSRLARSHICV